jgi:NAD(P)-dependent dehydrogenase (short-subunit alcohol dehydrogenase family)
MSRHDGKVAIVTAASRGIGFAVANRLIERDACVCITGRNQARLDEAIASLGRSDQTLAVAGHADDPKHQQAVFDAALNRFGRIDHLVNNAGINPVYGGLMSLAVDGARREFDVNCLAALAWTQCAYRA